MLSSPYRADIDCLRAVAVLLVIGFHWELYLLPGGFIGVDVFFVVSGYLITKMIVEGVFAGSFSFFSFYVRRARRLLPALYVVLLACAVAGWFVLSPPAMLDFWRSLASVVLLSSNVLFWLEAGYFDKPAAEKPLLHTWSLSVEEQFYLVVPVLLWILIQVFGRSRALVVALAALAGLSFAFSCWQTAYLPSAAFYLSPGRAWEFFVGSGLVVLEKQRAGPTLRAAALGLGVALIAIAALRFGPTTPFPGPAALLPCIGAALVIWAQWQPTSVLAASIQAGGAFIGRISYSLYLWHWPAYVLWRAHTGDGDNLSNDTKVLLFAAVLLLSVSSYFLVERPFRARRLLAGNPGFVAASSLLAASLAGFAGFAGFAGLATTMPALYGRFGAEAARIANYANYPYQGLYREGTCFLTHEQTFADYDHATCFKMDAGRQNVLLWGDSMAAHYLPGLTEFAARGGINLLHANASFCPPVFDLDVEQRPHCRGFNDGVGRLIRADPNIVVILSADWTTHEQGLGFDRLAEAIRSTVKRLNDGGTRTIVFGPSIRWRQHLSGELARRAEQKLDLSNTERLVLQSQFSLDERLKAALADPPYLSILDTICPRQSCPAFAGDAPMTWDANHLTREGSEMIIGKLGPRLMKDLKP